MHDCRGYLSVGIQCLEPPGIVPIKGRNSRRSITGSPGGDSVLENAPEIAPDVYRKRPAAVSQSARDVKAQDVKHGKRPEPHRRVPPLPGALERGRPIYPD